MATGEVERAYARRVAEYTEVVGRIEHTAPEDRAYVEAWSSTVSGPIIDVGCGPGQWTEFLRAGGAVIEGVDPVQAFVERARADYPSSSYRVGSAEALGVADHSVAGILAWYSLIHTEPDALDEIFAEFARALKPGGSLLLGYFDGAPGTPFEHAVVTAYYCSAAALTDKLEACGLQPVDVVTRQDPGARPHGALMARTIN